MHILWLNIIEVFEVLQYLLGMVVHRRVVQIEPFEIVERRAHHALGHRRVEAATEFEQIDLVLLQQQALLCRRKEIVFGVIVVLCLLLMLIDVLVVLLHAERHQLPLVGESPGLLL